jgi:hypothetical protein
MGFQYDITDVIRELEQLDEWCNSHNMGGSFSSGVTVVQKHIKERITILKTIWNETDIRSGNDKIIITNFQDGFNRFDANRKMFHNIPIICTTNKRCSDYAVYTKIANLLEANKEDNNENKTD